jgi:hypothetical protein
VIYEVPCVMEYGSPVAVIGPIHEDPELGQPITHLHIDRRYEEGRSPFEIILVDSDIEIVMMPKTLLTHAPTIAYSYPELPELQAAHQHCRVVDGLCPHKKIPLEAGRKLFDGSTVCAGHGLRWSSDGFLVTDEAGLWSTAEELDVRARK